MRFLLGRVYYVPTQNSTSYFINYELELKGPLRKGANLEKLLLRDFSLDQFFQRASSEYVDFFTIPSECGWAFKPLYRVLNDLEGENNLDLYRNAKTASKIGYTFFLCNLRTDHKQFLLKSWSIFYCLYFITMNSHHKINEEEAYAEVIFELDTLIKMKGLAIIDHTQRKRVIEELKSLCELRTEHLAIAKNDYMTYTNRPVVKQLGMTRIPLKPIVVTMQIDLIIFNNLNLRCLHLREDFCQTFFKRYVLTFKGRRYQYAGFVVTRILNELSMTFLKKTIWYQGLIPEDISFEKDRLQIQKVVRMCIYYMEDEGYIKVYELNDDQDYVVCKRT